MPKFFQISKFTEKQVFHENVNSDRIASRCKELTENAFLQIYARCENKEFNVLCQKNGKISFKEKTIGSQEVAPIQHNRQKQYIIPEGTIVEPLIDMGIFTKDGKIVQSMYDKYKQINRLIEIIDDSVRQHDYKKLNVIDFGCGKGRVDFYLSYSVKVKMIGVEFDPRLYNSALKNSQTALSSTRVSFVNCDARDYVIDLDITGAYFFNPFNDISFILLRVLLVMVYALIIESSLLSLEKRYLYDKLFYGNRTSKKVREYIKKYYYQDLLNKNIRENKRIEKYLKDPEMYNGFLNRQAKKKTNVEIDNFYLLDRIRFDRFYNRKKSKLTFSWSNYDNFYLAISLILFVLVVIIGR
jgi:SAM-dependent methyltransferase